MSETAHAPAMVRVMARDSLGGFLKSLYPLGFLFPALCMTGVWAYGPLLKTVYYSFISWNMLPTSTPLWVGMENFRLLLEHPDFKQKQIINSFVRWGIK
jgi:ABC-type sugar transport system permease subunit